MKFAGASIMATSRRDGAYGLDEGSRAPDIWMKAVPGTRRAQE
jgi:hypothetical protein